MAKGKALGTISNKPIEGVGADYALIEDLIASTKRMKDGGADSFDPVVSADEYDFIQLTSLSSTISGTDGDDRMRGTRDGDTIDGHGGNDSLAGGGGDDIITGGAGDDNLRGGTGFDTAVFSGSIFDYSITSGKGNSVIVSGADGTDTLNQMEAVQFADYTYYIDGRNNGPFTQDDAGETNEDTSVNFSGLLDNDIDLDGDNFTITAVAASGSGATVTLETDGTVTYNPNGAYENLAAGETATDTFTYTVTDDRGATRDATVSVAITGVNDAPVGGDDAVVAGEDSALTISADSLLANDSDVDSSTLSISSVDGSGTLGTVSFDGTDIVYDPNGQFESLAAGETATDTFTYTVDDGNGGFDTATVTVTIEGADDVVPNPTNVSFETGDFGDWSTLGQTFVVTQSTTEFPSNRAINPTDGTYFAHLAAKNGVGEDSLEALLGVGSDAIDRLSTGAAFNGSAISTTFTLQAGDTIYFSWYFDADDTTRDNDAAFVTDLDGSLILLSDIATVGNYGITGWQTSSVTATADGTYDFGFAVVNMNDNNGDSELYIDNVYIA